MKILKKSTKLLAYILLIPVVYMVISLLLSLVTVNTAEKVNTPHAIYLNTNGIHLDIIVPKKDLDRKILEGITHLDDENYVAFGWGDQAFYIDTPQMADISLSTTLKAMFLKTPTLLHVSRYKSQRVKWVKIMLTAEDLSALNAYIYQTFKLDDMQNIIQLDLKGYSTRDNFYKAKGNYSFLKTCNTWVNSGLKQSGIKSCLWTPFDFVLLNKHRNSE